MGKIMTLNEICELKRKKEVQETWNEINRLYGMPYTSGESLRNASARDFYGSGKGGIERPSNTVEREKVKTATELIEEEKHGLSQFI